MNINLADYARQYIEAREQWACSYEADMALQDGIFWKMTSSRTDNLKQWMDECYDSFINAAAMLGVPEHEADQLVFNLEAKV